MKNLNLLHLHKKEQDAHVRISPTRKTQPNSPTNENADEHERGINDFNSDPREAVPRSHRTREGLHRRGSQLQPWKLRLHCEPDLTVQESSLFCRKEVKITSQAAA